MGLRETTNYFAGFQGNTRGGPFEYGNGECRDDYQGFSPYGGAQFAPLVDKLVGNAFPIVKHVCDNMRHVRYVSANMEAIVYLAQSQATVIAQLQAQVALLNALMNVANTPNIVAPPLSFSRD
jgi:hypothetical protein